MFHLFAFNILESAHALEHLVPIYLGAVKLRTVDADKLSLATDGQTAGTAHTGSIHHDGIERNVCGKIIFLGQETAELHHDRRTDGENLIDMLLIDKLLDSYGYNTLLAVTSVIGHDDELIARCTHFIFHNHEVFVPTRNYGKDSVSCGFQCLDDREHRSYAYTTSGTNDCSEVLDMCRISKWSHHIVNFIAFIQCTEFGR